MLTDRQKQTAIRRRNFEAHVQDCEHCECPTTDEPGGPRATLCMSGQIMLAHLVRTLKETR